VEKICDKASVILYQCCVTGKHIPTARITCRKNDGDLKVEYLVVDLKDIMVSKVAWAGDGGQQSLNETVQLSFAEFKLNYQVQADTGDSAAKGATSFGFNIQRQQKT
jgi:type VI secretion system secreted protein Hcp